MPRKKKSKDITETKPYFIIDNEKLFKPDSDSIKDINNETEDLLNGSIYSNALKKAIENAPVDNGTFVIGLFGEWGIGKSTIIKNVKEDLEQSTEKSYKFVIYDAWKFVKDSFRRAFLLHLADSLKLDKTPYMDKFYTTISEDKEIKVIYNSHKFWCFTVFPWVLCLSSIVCLWIWGKEDSNIIKIIYTILIPFITLIINSLGKIFDELKITKQTPAIFSAEQFTECFADILEKSLKKTNYVKRLYNWVIGKPNCDKLVIVIDNIDRCSAETTYELLSTIKTFLINHDNLILVIPVDEIALCEHLQERFGNNQMRAKEFLRKIFNLEIRIKPLENIELYDFANKTNQDYNLGFSPDAIDIISKEYASNPRRIIQFFNNAKAEWDIISQRLQGFSDADIELAKNTMCKLLIIREEWDFYYNQIRQDPSKLSYEAYSGPEDKKSISALNTFLKSTEFYPIITDESKLNKIISNNKLFDDLPIRTIADLHSLDIENVSAFIKQSEYNQSKIVKYLEKQLKIAIGRQTFGTAASLFKFILQINKNIKGFSNINNVVLQTALKEHIDHIVSTILEKAHDEAFDNNLVMYINMLNDSKNTYLFTEIMDKCIIPLIKMPDNPNNYIPTQTDLLYSNMIKGVTDKKLFGKYRKQFSTWKQYIPDEIMDINDIPVDDLKYFITDDLQERFIDKISLQNDKTDYLDVNIRLLKGYKQNPALVKKIAATLSALYPQYNIGQKSRSILLLNGILPLLDTIKPTNYDESLSSLIIQLLSHKGYGYTIAANEPYADTDEYVKMINLLCKVLNYTLDREIPTSKNKELNQFIINCIQILKKRHSGLQVDLLAGIEKYITNKQVIKCDLADLIFNGNIYNSNYNSIMKSMIGWHYSNRDTTAPDYWCINDNKLAAEIQRFLPKINTEDSATKQLLIDLIDYLSKERENAVKLALQNITDCSIIANLPDKPKEIALQIIYANLEKYESDIPMLKLVAQNADKDVLYSLVNNILLKKMVDSSTKSAALEVFESIPKSKAVRYKKKINALK